MIRRPPRSTRKESSAASDVYKRQDHDHHGSIEKRKKWNFTARFIISGIVFSIFFILVYVLFFQQVQDTYRDLINILIGTYVAVLTKTTDYWFKEKDDPEHKESTDLHTKPSE